MIRLLRENEDANLASFLGVRLIRFRNNAFVFLQEHQGHFSKSSFRTD